MCMPINHSWRYLLAIAAVLMLGGCESSLQNIIEETLPQRDAEYKSSRRLAPLEIPPDLTSTRVGERLAVPSSGEVKFSDLSDGTSSVQTITEVLPQQRDIRVERDGNKRWLVVSAPPEQVWSRLREFWVESGFLIKVEDASIGIIETGWAEKRSDIPKGIIQTLMSKLSTDLYSAGTRDKFRSRLERGDRPGSTEVYVSHRGAREIRTSTNATPDQASTDFGTGDGYRWEPRASDPELEAEMLTRMMTFFGMDQSVAQKRLVSKRERAPRAHIVRDDEGGVVLALREDFSQAWRRTGLALDRVGFTVEDRDRSRGMYFVRYVDPAKEEIEKDEGLLSKLTFWGDDDGPKENEYLISIVGGENTTRVVVLDKRGKREVSSTATRILGLLHDELK
jgi:outer membrane protein assembly factor BamC